MRKILLTLTVVPFAFATADNLLINGSFDSGIVDWDIYNDNLRSITWEQSDGNTAQGCLEISSKLNLGGAVYSSSSQIPVVANETYSYKAYVKPLSSSFASGVTIWIEWRNSNGQYTGFNSNYFAVSTTQANDSWTLIDEQVIAPPEMYYAVVQVAVNGLSDSSDSLSLARFDDISFTVSDSLFKDGFE